jgi:hypothetical protein
VNRIKTFLADGSNPNGRIFAGDLNALQDAVAALTDLAQALGVGSIALGESGLQFVRYRQSRSSRHRSDAHRRHFARARRHDCRCLHDDCSQRDHEPALRLGDPQHRHQSVRVEQGHAECPQLDSDGQPAHIWHRRAGEPASGFGCHLGLDVLGNRSSGRLCQQRNELAAQGAAGGSNCHVAQRLGTDRMGDLRWWRTSGSTGIYADLYTHLGSTTTKPDTRGRVTVGQGSHADVDAINDNDGITVANSDSCACSQQTGSTLPNHAHPLLLAAHICRLLHAGSASARIAGVTGSYGPTPLAGWFSARAGLVSISVANPTSNAGHRRNHWPFRVEAKLDSVPWITALKIAKL